jgi:hypothetical protein
LYAAILFVQNLGFIQLAALWIAALPNGEALNRFWNDGAWVDLAELVVQILDFYVLI